MISLIDRLFSDSGRGYQSQRGYGDRGGGRGGYDSRGPPRTPMMNSGPPRRGPPREGENTMDDPMIARTLFCGNLAYEVRGLRLF